MNSSESIKNIAVALNKAQSEMGTVTKGSENPFYKSKYADINDVIKTIKDVLNSNGITYLQPLKVMEVAGEKVNIVETILLHTSGEYISSEIEVVQKDKTDPQKLGAAVTYSRRFGLQSLIGLPAEDDDGNKASGKGEAKSPVKAKAASKKPAEKANKEAGDSDEAKPTSFNRRRNIKKKAVDEDDL